MASNELLCRLEPSAGGWRVLGDLNFTSAPQLLTQAKAQLDFSQSLQIDLSQVNHADSAGLALMLEWLEQAQAAQGSIQFHAIPEALVNLAQLCNVEGLIGGERPA
ncbi:MAG: STAS domain-containing protein [Gammaproteobacteria bacterium]|nr:STAS domain-containing protein [Gammaproteobacteria bacterium]